MKLKKSLSQHILINRRVSQRIVDLAVPESNKEVVEIGSGTGVLTEQLAGRANKVYAIELDKEMVCRLEEKFKGESKVEIINRDFLEVPLSGFINPLVIGNIPYSISTKIIEKLVKERDFFSRAVLTIQKEYGERLLANPGQKSYGSITVFTRYYFTIKKGFIIPASQFYPKPKVASMVIVMTRRPEPHRAVVRDETDFFKFVRKIFSYRRKKVSTILKRYFGVVMVLDKRPEELPVEDFIDIYNKSIGV